eukprot:Ihof_evm2s1029 gene=Ihof_evmTU2s1029
MSLGSWLRSDTTRCPHCRGQGQTCRTSQTTELTSWIPTSDRRLKPRRTKLWAGLSVIFTTLVLILFVFFFYPRSVRIEYGSLETLRSSIDTLPLNITLRQTITITNNNYVPVQISPLDMIVFFYTLLVSVNNSTTIHVPPRTAIQVDFEADVGYNITGEYVDRVRRNCRRHGHKSYPRE